MRAFGTDFDGVIINVETQKAQAFGSLLNKAWNLDKKEAVNFWANSGGTSRRYKFDYLYMKQFNKKLVDHIYKKVESEFSRTLKNNFYPKAALLPGALELLQYARNHFDFMFVSSGVPMLEIQYLTNLTKVSEYFDFILGTNEKYISKEDHFKEIIENKKPDLTVFVADGIEDMRVAKKFDLISIGIPTNNSRDDLFDAGATYICNLSEVCSLIEEKIFN